MFNTWLLEKLKELNWTQADLAHYSGLTKGAISNYINGRIPDKKALLKIAKAIKVPNEIIFRAANLLPKEDKKTELIEEAIHLLQELPIEEQEGIIEFIKLRNNLVEKHEKNERERNKKYSTNL